MSDGAGIVLVGTVATAFVTLLLGVLTMVFNRKTNAANTQLTEANTRLSEANEKVAAADETKKRAEAVGVEVASLSSVITTLTGRLEAQDRQIQSLSERAIANAVKLDAADLRTGVLERREREYLVERAETAAYIELLIAQCRAAGFDVPDRPPAVEPRIERTRRTDREGQP